MKFKKYFYKKINNKNDIAIQKIKTGITKGIVVAEFQNKGRGNIGKKWISFKGNLFMTIFFQVSKTASIKKMTKINCEVIKNALTKYFKIKISIKYPNDLLINKKNFVEFYKKQHLIDKLNT